jgi:hypothetical protein
MLCSLNYAHSSDRSLNSPDKGSIEASADLRQELNAIIEDLRALSAELRALTEQQTIQSMNVGAAAPIRPIDSLEEARRQAMDWLTLTRQEDLSVGSIRKIDWIYIVNIVDKKSPHNLRNQLIIRGADGFYMTVH